MVFLANKIEELVAAIPPERKDEPMKRPFVYVGYSKNADRRVQQNHQQHRSSSYVMNATEAIALWLFDGQYELYFFPVFLIFEDDQATPAEIIFSRIAPYTSTGAGFAHYPAGRSNNSVEMIPAKRWREFQDFAMKYSPLVENHERELIRMREDMKMVDERIAVVVEQRRKISQTQHKRAAAPSEGQQEVLDGLSERVDQTRDKIEALKVQIEVRNAKVHQREKQVLGFFRSKLAWSASSLPI